MRTNLRFTARCLAVLTANIPLVLAQGGPSDSPRLLAGTVPEAPPPAPPVEFRVLPERPRLRPQGPTLYSIGDPTDEEQLYLEYINRSRANPPAEGTRLAATTDPDVVSAYNFFGVDLALMQNQFDAIAPAPPLAMNAQLTAAARLHSADMFTKQYQDHYETNGTTVLGPGDRITAQGYTWSTYGENIFSYAKSVWHGHVAFNVDWGSGPGGMQSPPGHRNNIASAAFREVGVGIVDGSNGSVGPQLVTQDFGTRQSATPLVIGVVYYDFNTNNFYDIAEGIGGVTVDVTGSSYHAVTANSGGYAVPVPGNGTYTVTFTAPGLATSQQQVTVSASRNLKLDYLPVYAPPLISGPNPAGLNQSNVYSFSPVGGATSYQWEQAKVAPFTTVETADNGLTDFTTDTSAGYSVITSSPNGSGNSFHLAHPNPAADQVLTYTRVLLPGANAELQFKSRLGVASSNQVAKVQLSVDQGNSWQDVYSQPGAYPSSQEMTFTTRTVSLAGFAASSILVRFVYDYQGGVYYVGANTGTGWYFDDISFSDTEELTDAAIADIASGTSFVFNPTNAGDYLLRVRANLPGRTLAFGPAKRVTASTVVPATVQFSSVPSVAGGQVQVDFDVANYNTSMTFQLLQSSDVSGGWTTNGSASFQPIVANSKFRVTTSTGGASRMFYRIQAN